VPRRIDNLTRRRIAQEALAVIDEEGLDALTMRGVAARMGVGVMSLYHHTPNKETLLSDVVDAVLAEIDVPPRQYGDYRQPLRAMLTSARRVILRHPSAVPLLAARQPTTAAALGAMDAEIGTLLRAGFDPAGAARVHRCLASYLLGYVSLELSGFFPADSANHDLHDHERLAAAYPSLGAAAPHLLAHDADADFDAGLQALLTGFPRESSPSDRPSPSESGPPRAEVSGLIGPD
jgi:TetR/AcrR family transcriptional regulator, tetracycline repressor protein